MSTPTTNTRVSRVGKRPVPVPAGVTVTLSATKIEAKGPKGTFSKDLPPNVEVAKQGNDLHVTPKAGLGVMGAQYQGLARALVKNVVEGVSKGYDVALDLIGTGYRAELKGQDLTLALGLSHQVNFPLPPSVKGRVEIIDVGGTKKPRLHLSSYDKELLSQTASHIRSFRPPEPYKGKGVRFVDEKVREKAGKAGKGAGKK
jgi:large subunit ribosomal protein L6